MLNNIKYIITKDIEIERNITVLIRDDLNKINEIWKTIERQIYDHEIKSDKKEQEKSLNKFKPIRMFVSSTFTDFFSEREILVKQFFPELREWCLRRNLDLIECDLRWGVPAETTSDDTILTCLRELDRCFKENDGKPFFIGLLGEKYGWVPDITKLSSELVQEYNWIPNISITFMEYLHGALRSKNSNACFFIRSKESLDGIPPEFNEKFFETVPFSKLQLQIEKEKLRSDYKKQVVEYSCKFDGFDETTGRKRPKLSGLENFGHQVLEFLKNAIMRTYPDATESILDLNNLNLDTQERLIEEENIHQTFYSKKQSNFFVGFNDPINAALKYINTGRISYSYFKQLIKIDESLIEKEIDNHHHHSIRPLIIFGPEGCGKTSFIAHLANILDKQYQVFYHFSFASNQSNLSKTIFNRFISFFAHKNSSKCGQYFKEFQSYFEQTISTDSKKIILIDDLDLKNLELAEWFKHLNQFKFNPNTIIIISINDNNKKEMIKLWDEDSSLYCITLCYLDKNESQNLIQQYLEKFNKKLDDLQMNLLLSKSDKNYSPLWLTLVCNELRIFGEFSTVNNKIKSFSIDPTQLVLQILERINSDYRSNIVVDVLCFICCSFNGIPESEMCCLFQNSGLNMTRLEWSQISTSLKQFISINSFSSCQVVNFNDRRIYQIVLDNFILKKRDFYIKNIIEHFKNNSQYQNIAIYECIEGYKKLDMKKELVEYLKSPKADHLNSLFKSINFNFARCIQIVVDSPISDTLKICLFCKNNKIGINLVKDACFICGSLIPLNFNKKTAKKCLKHSFNKRSNVVMIECFICKRMVSNITNNYLDALLCMACSNGNRCCMFEFEN